MANGGYTETTYGQTGTDWGNQDYCGANSDHIGTTRGQTGINRGHSGTTGSNRDQPMATAPGGDHSPAPRSSPPRPSPLRQSQARSQVPITIRDQPDGRGGGPSAEAKLPGGCGAAGVSSVRCCVSYGSGLRGTAPVRTAAHCGAPLPAAPYRSVPQRIAGHRSLRHRTGPYGSVLTGTAPSGAAAPAPGGAMMACAELLAVCLLSADRGPAPRRQPLPIFHDVSTAGTPAIPSVPPRGQPGPRCRLWAVIAGAG